MIGQGFGSEIAKALWVVVGYLIIIAFLTGAGAVWLLPKLWSWLKPILHTLTA